jgi:glucosamine 6-phosphate synthetase-like amidotransferase/phosphosugar isomerase protein
MKMCGISGFIRLSKMSNKEAIKLSKELLLSLEYRGEDATGIYTSNQVVKAPVPADVFVDLKIYPKKIGYITLLHCRQATKGSPKVYTNNHPVISKNWTLVHNGMIWNSKLSKYNYRGEVDSEILLSYIERFGIKLALNLLRGSAALGICRRYNPRAIYVWANSNPISFGYVPEKAFVFSSTTDSILEACEIFGKINKFTKVYIYEPEKYVLYQMTSRGIRDLGTYGKRDFYLTSNYAYYYREYVSYQGNHSDGKHHKSYSSKRVNSKRNADNEEDNLTAVKNYKVEVGDLTIIFEDDWNLEVVNAIKNRLRMRTSD